MGHTSQKRGDKGQGGAKREDGQQHERDHGREEQQEEEGRECGHGLGGPT